MGEAQRLAFIEARDGIQAAVEFARMAQGIYRACILSHRREVVGQNRRNFAKDRENRKRIIQSCREFRAYIDRVGNSSSTQS